MIKVSVIVFPRICHIHYKKISSIVRKTAEEYGIPYRSKKYFVQAIADHARMLKLLGRYDDLALVKQGS